MTTSAERAARLMLVNTEPPPVSGVGGWRFRVVGPEVQLRNARLPHLRMDLLLTEACDLTDTLCLAVSELKSHPVVRVSWLRRGLDWLARRSWRRRHAVEQAAALKALADEFRANGGWQ